MLTAPVGNSHGLANDGHPLDPLRAFQLHFDDHAPEQPPVSFDEHFHSELHDMFKHPRQHEIAARLLKLVRTEVLTANQAVWARLEQLERRVAESSEVRPDRDEFQSPELAAQMESQTQERQSRYVGPISTVAAAADNPGQVPDSGEAGCAPFVSWKEMQTQKDIGLQYEFTESVWDLVVFVGINVMHPADEFMALFAGACNMLVNVLVIIIVFKIAQLDEDDPGHDDFVDAMLKWRVMYAHTPKYANSITNKPLSYQVCARDPTIMEGTFQANIYVNIHSYLDSSLGFNSGDLLCMFAVLLWLITCSDEAMQCVGMFQGIWCTVHLSGRQELKGYHRLLSAKSGLALQAAEDASGRGAMACKSLRFRCSFVRGCMVTVFVVLPRLALLAMLGTAGVNYLVATIELEELILNAVALELILHVDEMLFDLLVPAPSKLILAKTHPLPRQYWGPTAARVQTYVKIGVVACGFLFIRIELLDPIIKNLLEVERVMCGGDKEFIAADTSIGIVFAGQPTRSVAANTDGYQYSANLQRTKLSEARKLGSSLLYLDSDMPNPIYRFPDVKTAISLSDQTVGIVLSDQPCRYDMPWTSVQPPAGDNAMEAIMNYLATEFTSLSRPNCTTLHANEYCYTGDRKGTITRFFCPNTCGLYLPQSGNAFVDPALGVAGLCGSTMTYLLGWNALFGPFDGESPIQCKDVPTFDNSWSIYSKTVVNALDYIWSLLGNSSVGAASAQKVRTSLLRGCDAMRDPDFYVRDQRRTIIFNFSYSLCDPRALADNFLRVRSVRLLCPITCGCFGSVSNQYKRDGLYWSYEIGLKEQCPGSCFNYTL